MRQNKKIAITGGSGSGKSTVARLIAERGYDVFSCDLIAHEIYEEPNVVREILREFPDCATNGLPDRKKLSAAVFREKERLRALEKIRIPPSCANYMRAWKNLVRSCVCGSAASV
ncbi:MAG: dephospho-CoA kinase [Candidatus Borkfalkia sp.]